MTERKDGAVRVKHGLVIDWSYQELSCECGWKPKEWPLGVEGPDAATQFDDHIAEQPMPRKPRPKPEPVRTDYTREELIELCEAAIVPMEHWRDRDSAAAQRQVGDCWALLKAGVPFRIEKETDADTIWIEHYGIRGFKRFEYGDNTGPHPSGYGEGDNTDTETSYLPTRRGAVYQRRGQGRAHVHVPAARVAHVRSRRPARLGAVAHGDRSRHRQAGAQRARRADWPGVHRRPPGGVALGGQDLRRAAGCARGGRRGPGVTELAMASRLDGVGAHALTREGIELAIDIVEDSREIGDRIDEANVDGYRLGPVYVGNEQKAPAGEVPRLIAHLLEAQQRLTPEEFYPEFEQIHPFYDGNGRAGKVLYNWLRGSLDDPVWPPDFFSTPDHQIENP